MSSSPAARRLALGIVVLAGYADSVSYLQFHKVYASFMSGNTTALGVALASARWPHAAVLAGVVLTFVLGVVVGTWLHRVGPRPASSVLAAIAGLLVAAGLVPAGLWLLVLSMGMLNAAVHQTGKTALGLTYVTGALVKTGAALADGLGGRGWQPGWYWQALDWLCLAAGAVGGALAYGSLAQRGALVAAAGAALALALVARRATPD